MIKNLLFNSLYKIYSRTYPVSLMYHTISDANQTVAITKESFLNQLRFIHESSLEVIDEHEIRFKDTHIHLTFDDGYVDNLTTALPLLEQFNMKATIFITTGFLGKEFKYGLRLMSKTEVQELSKSSLITLGAHSMSHPKLNTLSYPEQQSEIIGSKHMLEDITGKEVDVFAPPFGKYNEETKEILLTNGFKKSYTTKHGVLSFEKPFEINRIAVMKSTEKHFKYFNTAGYLKYKAIVEKAKQHV